MMPPARWRARLEEQRQDPHTTAMIERAPDGI